LSDSRHHIIGTGRWGAWLARRLKATGFEIASLRNRTESSALKLAEELDVDWSLSDLANGLSFEKGDIVWCCVPDAEILNLKKSLNELTTPINIVHCSGTSPLIEGSSTGVFWPIQSFTKSAEPDWESLPIIVQSENEAFAKTLLEIASTISGLSPKQVFRNEDRMRLHLGAVMTQNFSNFLWTLTEEVLTKVESKGEVKKGNSKSANLNIQDLLPLATNHLKKLQKASPAHLQTGPAIRGDQNTMLAHLALLEEHPEAKEIYTLLSKHIGQQEK